MGGGKRKRERGKEDERRSQITSKECRKNARGAF